MAWKNKLFYGDNLYILREHIPDESIDLIYLDPPFNSQASYNILFQEKNGTKSVAQITAFEDTWHWGLESEQAYNEIVTQGPKSLADLMEAMRRFLGTNDMMAYLVMIAIRLIELYRILKPTGSIYLHCDPTASHYLKLLMDAIFGGKNFLNEIIWSYRRYTARSNRFQREHDILLFYGKTSKHKFNELRIEYGEKSGKADSHYKQDEDGRWYRWQKRKGKEPYKVYLSEGRRAGDVWTIPHINASAKERLGYPTQKPEALLERIIMASSDEGDLVLDPFCGCGTTIAVAERLNRRWIGIDITHLAVSLMKYRLENTFGEDLSPYEIIGVPYDLHGAKELAKQNKYEFQRWAVGLVEGMPMDVKTSDRGIDGYIYFYDDFSGRIKKVMIQVKSGNVNPSVVRDLRGVVERENADIGVLITLKKPTRGMEREAAAAGFYESDYGKFPKIQLLTIEELLNGKKIDMPTRLQSEVVTHKKAKRIRMDKEIQEEIFSLIEDEG